MQDDKIAPFADPISVVAPPPAKPRRWRSMLALLAVAFIVGLGAMAWMISNWGDARALLIADPVEQPAQRGGDQAIVVAPQAPIAALAAAPAGDVEQRIADLDARLARIDRGASLASQNALRAERLLVAFAARRALDRGASLGYLEEQLTSYFGTSEARAVGVIIAASRAPSTLAQLNSELEALKPTLIGGAKSGDWWGQFTATMGSLVVVREAGSGTTAPTELFARASSMLAAGRVDLALADVVQLPGSDGAAAWITHARRYVDANRSLDLLEAAALAEADVPPAGAMKDEPVPGDRL
jgi:hypothetical protein